VSLSERAETVIEINDLYKYYGERKAVGPLSFSIEAGEIVGLLGLNGAGKTTTLRVLSCDLLPSSGTVRVDGLDVVDHPHEVRSRIGYLPDVPPLYGEMTVREYLIFAARLRGMSNDEAQKRVPEVEDATRLTEVRDDVIASLSHGFRQRVGIAQAIVHRPRLLVLDEPISGLDPVQIVEMRELLRSLAGEHTILLSSHILSEISETCDRILVIRDGEIGASGTESELSTRLLQNVRVEVTVRHPRDDYRTSGDRVRTVVEKLPGVVSVEQFPAGAQAEVGEGIDTYLVEADRDVREALCQALVQSGVGVLELRRRERELENVFLRLAGSELHGSGRAKERIKRPRGGAAARGVDGPNGGSREARSAVEAPGGEDA
jgi:ABC-2 type transport system ATP-binding protein